MSRDDKMSTNESSSVLRAHNMNEVLPRHDLDLFTSSRMFPDGDWVLSEAGHRHQFQAAYCVPNQQGQLVPAPMPPVNISAVTNEEEVYRHCTVYQFAPSYQSRGDTEQQFVAGHATGHQYQNHGRVMPPGNYHQVPPPGHQNRHDSDRKQNFAPRGEGAFFANPPSYASLATAFANPPILDKVEGDVTSGSTQQQNLISFSGESSIEDFCSQQEQSFGSGSSISTSYSDSFRYNPVQEEIHGLELFAAQNLGSDQHRGSILPSDSFGSEFPSVMMAQLDDQPLDDLFSQSHDAGGDQPEADKTQHNQSDEQIHEDTTRVNGLR